MEGTEITRRFIVLIEDRADDVFLFVKATNEVLPTAKVEVFSDGISFEQWLHLTDREVIKQIDLVFLDINLPFKSGFHCLAMLKAHHDLCKVPTIFLTTSSQPAEIDRAYREGVHSYIVKPMEIHEFRKILKHTYTYWFDVVASPA